MYHHVDPLVLDFVLVHAVCRVLVTVQKSAVVAPHIALEDVRVHVKEVVKASVRFSVQLDAQPLVKVDAQGLVVHPAQVHAKMVVRGRAVLDALDNVHLDVIQVVVEDVNLVVLVVVPRQVVLVVVVETAHQTADTHVDRIVKVSVPVLVRKIVELLAL